MVDYEMEKWDSAGSCDFQWAKRFLGRYQTAQDSATQVPGGVREVSRWVPRAWGCWKLNIDGSVLVEEHGWGAGAVIRVEEGAFI